MIEVKVNRTSLLYTGMGVLLLKQDWSGFYTRVEAELNLGCSKRWFHMHTEARSKSTKWRYTTK